MKNAILISFLILSIFFTNAQEKDEINNANEVKINGLYLVLGAVEVTYERLLNEESGVGVSVFLPIDDEINDDIDYYISPYYRMYFGKKYASGFFVEGFGLLSSIKEYTFDSFGNFNEESVTDFALGIGVGGKWITKRGFLAELNFGVGRNLFNGDSIDDYVGKLGITLGYRF
ncbi:MAG: DUF3575 domain-containing protein [Flavobacteriaceae bacterium]|nr:DUF3575 domain-containing protein [Flavobacteriaceae bacterium]